MSKRCQSLLLQIYLHFPEIIQRVNLPGAVLRSEGAADGSTCKVGKHSTQHSSCFSSLTPGESKDATTVLHHIRNICNICNNVIYHGIWHKR